MQDWKAVEELGLLAKGSVVVADHVIDPCSPECLQSVRGGEGHSSTEVESHMPNDRDMEK